MSRRLRAAAPLALATALAGCATGGAGSAPLARLSPLVSALTEPVPELQAAAVRGDASAQYALSVLAADGLRGVPKDPDRAKTLRRQATAPKGNTAVTQFIPGINGAPGRVHIINMPQYDPAMAALPFMDGCVEALRTGKLSAGSGACGSTEMYDWLRRRWAGLDAPAPAVWRLASLSCDDEAAIGALWARAAAAFEAEQYATAAAAAERIIGACGAAQESWRPRVMRALLALADNDHRKALALLEPVPRPAPAPIGGYSSFVAMRAYASAGDWAAFSRERDALVTASARALTGGRAPAVFTAGGAKASVVETDLALGHVRSRRAFLITPADPRAGPLAIHLTTGEDVLGSGQPRWFLDEYRCDGRATLKYFEPSAAAPAPAEVERLVRERLNGRLAETSGSSWNIGMTACQFPMQVAPGLIDAAG